MNRDRQLRATIVLLVSATMLLPGLAFPFPSQAHHPPLKVSGNEVVGVWLTDLSGSARLSPQPNTSFAQDSGFSPLTITVDETIQFQQIEGFGASFTDSSAWLVYNKLNTAQRNVLLSNLFSPTNGIGLRLLRQPLGASDFSTVGNYSYDDMPPGQTDPNLTNFSINHDSAYIIPVLKQALQINPAIQIIGTPWSPPGWMKTSGSMIGGNLKPEAFAPLANYFVKYIQAYQAQGVTVNYVTVQNEPLYIPPGYPGMGMSASEQTGFIKNNLGPALVANHLNTKLLAYDHNWDQPNYPATVLADAAAAQYVSGVAWHWYGGDVSAQSTVHNAYPGKAAFITEASGGGWQGGDANGFREALNLVINGSRNWASGVVLWNMALDTNSGPTNGGCGNCRGVVTIDQSSGNVTYNVDYYALGHAGKFLQPGAYRIGSNTFGSNLEDVAFRNQDGSKVLVVRNASSAPSTFKVLWGNESFSYTLNGGAAATFVWSGSPGSVAQLLSRSTWTGAASVSAANAQPANAFDGNALTRWTTGQPQATGQWFQLDLGSAQAFNHIVMDAGPDEFPRAYQVYVSNDANNWGSAIAGGAGTSQSTSVGFAPQVARYIRVTQIGSASASWSLAEISLYSGGATGALPRGGWISSASVSNSGDTPANALDGNAGTRWSTGQPQTNGQWFQVDLGSPQTFFQVEMDSALSAGDFAHGFQVLVSNDGINWSSPLVTGVGGSQVINVTFASQTTRYVRIFQTGSAVQWWSLHELNLLATAAAPSGSPAPILLTTANTNLATALDSVLFTTQPFSLTNTLNFSTDHHTRVLLLTGNLELLQGEDPAAITAEALDAQNTIYPLSIEYVGKVPDHNWLSAVVVRLPDNQALNGEVSVRLSLHGVSSNAAVLQLNSQ